MVASTDIKFYVHTNNNAPQLQNAYGSMINVLDACLVNGINIGTISSLTASGNTVTATFGAAHNLMQYQVIKITGANQREFNGEHRILTVQNAQSVTFELAVAPSTTTATGTITASLPSLGWEKPFSSSNPTGGGKAAYRSLNLLLPSRPFLRVVDELDPAYTATYAKYAKVGIVEDMTDIDTMLGGQAPFDAALPNKNWVGTGSGTSAINGWAKWFYATGGNETQKVSKTTTPGSGERAWVLVGDGDTFYVFNKSHIVANNLLNPNGFGRLKNLSKIGASPWFLVAQDDYTGANTATYAGFTPLTASNTDAALITYMLRNYRNEAIPSIARSFAISGLNQASGYSTTFSSPDDHIAAFSSEYILAEDQKTPRGIVPILRWLHQRQPYTHLQPMIDDGHMKLACDCVSYTYQGQILFDLGEL